MLKLVGLEILHSNTYSGLKANMFAIPTPVRCSVEDSVVKIVSGAAVSVRGSDRLPHGITPKPPRKCGVGLPFHIVTALVMAQGTVYIAQDTRMPLVVAICP